jgi:lipopolysaccharide transport system ATP-binding protein
MASIQCSNINLHYSSLAYQETSLKSYIFKLFKLKQKKALNDVHALKNINLEVRSGERVALIGHNGAGKSTLLKTLAGLYPISSGTFSVEGTIRSLLELSTGFEPEATGRENILYRGLLLGQKPSHMRNIANEIIEFADIGEFIDYPIKVYSAGMLVRLAFAISTAIPGDLLLLDEVIAAGDAAFTIKARERIHNLLNKAEIVIFASHDFSSVRDLCERGIVLNHGVIEFDGKIEEAIQHYLNSIQT